MTFKDWFTAMALLTASQMAFAQPVLVHVEARCSDKTIEYNMGQYAQDTVRNSGSHKLENTASTTIRVTLSAAPVKTKGGEKEPPLGISFAMLVRKRSTTGSWDVTAFQNSFVPIDEIEKTVRSSVAEAIK